MSVNFSEILPVLVGGGVVVALITWLRFYRKDDAERQKTLAEAAKIKREEESTLVEDSLAYAKQLGEECKVAKDKLAAAEKRLDVALTRGDRLEREVHNNNIEMSDLRERLTSEILKNLQLENKVKELVNELEYYKRRGPDSTPQAPTKR